jgi:hypothetical protein
MQRRVLLATVTAALTGGALASPASAGDEWCECDPPLQIETPGGTKDIVFVVDAGPGEYQSQLKRPSIAYTVARLKGGRTQVVVTVVIPTAGDVSFPVRSRIWSSPGQGGVLFSETFGLSGETLTHTFVLGVA